MDSSVTTPLLAAPPSIDTSDETLDEDPKRQLSLFDGIAIVLGLQIGSGIFTSPSLVVRNTGSEPVALLIWCVAGTLTWACAACYIELGIRLPVNGGPQEYLVHCFGDLYGFVASWACIFTVKPCSAAIQALVVADYICDASNLQIASLKYVRTLVAIAIITLVAATNCTGNKLSNITTKSLLACKIVGISFVIVMGFIVLVVRDGVPASVVSNELASLPRPGLSSYTDATLSAMWAYSGWETLAFVGGELKNPSRNIFLVINTAMTIVIAFCVLANIAYFSALTFEEIVNSPTIGLTFSRHFLGHAGGALYTVLICLSCMGTLNIKFFTAGRLTQAAAERQFLPPFIKTVAHVKSNHEDEPVEVEANPRPRRIKFLWRPTRFGDGSVPLSAIIFNALLAGVYVLVGDFGALIIFIGIVEYSVTFFTILGLLTLRLRPKSPDNVLSRVIFKVPWLFIFVALAATAFIVSVSVIRHPFSGVGFILFCLMSAGIYEYVIRVIRV